MRPGDDGYINVPEGETMMTLEVDCCVNFVIQLADGRLAFGSVDSTIKIWDAISGSFLVNLEGHDNYVRYVIQLSDGRLVSCSDDNTLKIWDTISGCCLKTLRGHNDSVRCVTQLTDGRLVSGSDDSTIKIWVSKTRMPMLLKMYHLHRTHQLHRLQFQQGICNHSNRRRLRRV